MLRRASWLSLALMATLMTSMIGCAKHELPESALKATAKARSGKAPIWQTTATPWPLPIVKLVPGGSQTVFVGAPPFEEPVSAFDVSSSENIGLSLSASDLRRVVVSSTETSKGQTVVTVTRSGKDPAEAPFRQSFIVVIEPTPLKDFVYTPAEGKKVEWVAVAGEFNGWSQSRFRMAKGEDGVFRGRFPIEPGKYTYKLVVDGEWLADPSNPVLDESGFGNSVLAVQGEASKTFDWWTLGADMPGGGPQGAFRARLPEGAALAPESVVVIVNNVLMPTGSFTLEENGTVVRLDVPADQWLDENAVVLMAKDSRGAVGTLGRLVTSSAAARSPRDEVIYFSLTDRFRDGNTSLNKPSSNPDLFHLANYKGGDFAGIRQKIEEGYFTDMGVTTLWLSPPNKNTPKVHVESVPPGRLFTSYHGYWPISSTETNEQFGSMDDLRALVKAAHARGIAVIIDFVAAHVHEDHPLYKEHPTWTVPLELPDGTKNIRQFDAHPLTTWFDTFLPKLDYAAQPELVEMMTANAEWWLRQTGADGFRHDAVKHIPTPFWQRLTERVKEDFEEKEGRFVYQVGETISGYDTINQYVGPDLMTGQFDFPLYFGVQSVLARGRGEMADLGAASLKSQEEYPLGSIMSPLVGNHDVGRFMFYADGDAAEGVDEKEIGYSNPPSVDDPTSFDKLQLAFAFLMAQHGPPMIYYGDEIGMTGAQDPDNRRPMQWEGWNEYQIATRSWVSKLASARHGSVALRRGTTEVLFGDAERLVMLRTTPEQSVLILLSRRPADMGLTMSWPAWWGNPTGLKPLVVKAVDATVTPTGVAFADAPYSFGMWEVSWAPSGS